ncbi:MAG: hypothetical protein OEM91_04820 [Hyphomicrobiales bacterium]|nr:hypothetical protein [Hyphomicrobiales bacterium]
MRQVISFLMASALLGGGLYLLYLQVFHSTTIYGLFLIGAAVAILGGISWLFCDFILLMSRKKDND